MPIDTQINDLARDDGLETAVLLSLFLDRRAESGDALPSGETDHRGWWADAFPVIEGDQIGSRLWLFDRSKETPAALGKYEQAAREALTWLIEDRVAQKLEVVAEVLRPGVWALTVTIFRPQVDPVTFRFNNVWAAQEV
jgi:phage gp46-like protein